MHEEMNDPLRPRRMMGETRGSRSRPAQQRREGKETDAGARFTEEASAVRELSFGIQCMGE